MLTWQLNWLTELSEKGFDEYHVDGAEFKKDAMEMYKTNSDIIKEFNLSAN